MRQLFKERLLTLLQEEIKFLDETAKNLDKLIPHLVGDVQKAEWSAAQEVFRARSKSLRASVERFEDEP